METKEITASTSRTGEEIQNLIAAWKQSGKSKKLFCLDNNITYQTFIGWTCRKEKTPHRKGEKFIPITLGGEKKFAELFLKNGSRVCFYQAVDAALLGNLLK